MCVCVCINSIIQLGATTRIFCVNFLPNSKNNSKIKTEEIFVNYYSILLLFSSECNWTATECAATAIEGERYTEAGARCTLQCKRTLIFQLYLQGNIFEFIIMIVALYYILILPLRIVLCCNNNALANGFRTNGIHDTYSENEWTQANKHIGINERQ